MTPGLNYISIFEFQILLNNRFENIDQGLVIKKKKYDGEIRQYNKYV